MLRASNDYFYMSSITDRPLPHVTVVSELCGTSAIRRRLKPWFHDKIKTQKLFKVILDVVSCWNKIISDPSRRRRSTVLKLFYFTRDSIMKWNKILLAKLRPSSEFRCLSNVFASLWAEFTGAFSLAFMRAAPSDYSRQMLRLAATTASWIFMLK